MSNDLIDSLPNGPSVDRGVNENENDSSIKAVDDGHFLINDAALAGVHTQFQLPKSIAINQTNVIFTSDGAVYVMVKPPDHGNVMASVNQHLNNMAFQQPPPIDPGLEGTVGDGTVGDATTPSLSMTSPSISLPDKKRREEENSSLLGEARPHDNKRVRYSSPAEALAFQQHAHQSGGSDLALATTTSRVYPLATELDDRNLSQYQCLTRRQIEVFSATEDIAGSTAQGRNRPISVGQVGIRCRHCYLIPLKERKTGSSYFPTKLNGLYQTAQKMAANHLIKVCPMLPEDTRKRLIYLKSQKSSEGGGKSYWAEGVQRLGVIETCNGLSFANE